MIAHHFKSLSFICSFACLFFACKKDPVIPPSSGRLDFQSPAVNQENLYLGYFGICGYVFPTRDTLKLRIESFDGTELQLSEQFTPGSPSFANTPNAYTYTTAWNEDFIITTHALREQSKLFYYFGPDTLRISQAASLNVVQDQCRIYHDAVPFQGGEIGHLPAFEIDSQEYLLKKVISQVVLGDTNLIWDAFLIFDSHTIYATYRNVKEGIEVQSPTVSVFALLDTE